MCVLSGLSPCADLRTRWQILPQRVWTCALLFMACKCNVTHMFIHRCARKHLFWTPSHTHTCFHLWVLQSLRGTDVLSVAWTWPLCVQSYKSNPFEVPLVHHADLLEGGRGGSFGMAANFWGKSRILLTRLRSIIILLSSTVLFEAAGVSVALTIASTTWKDIANTF